MNTLAPYRATEASLSRQKPVVNPDTSRSLRRLGRFLLTSLQIAILAPLAPMILLSWAVYWCVDGESLEQVSRSTDIPQIGTL